MPKGVSRGWRAEDIVENSERFRRVSEGMMAINPGIRNYWQLDDDPEPFGPAIRSAEVPYGVTSPAVDVLTGETRQPQRHGSRGPHTYNIHNEPDIAKRLVRMIEELLERDDALPGADLLWYRNRLEEIKKELADAEEGISEAVRPTGEGAAREAASGSRTANGGLLSGD